MNRGKFLWPVLWTLLAASFLISLHAGSAALSVQELWKSILAGPLNSEGAGVILWQIRLPRALLAVLVGASLGIAGAAMQGLLRNPLAEPGIMGVNGGAVFGAVLALYTGWYAKFSLALPIAGIAGALLSVAIIYLLAGQLHTVQTLILGGIAVNTLAFAGTALVLNLSNNPYAAIEMVFWQMGSLADRSFDHILLAGPFILAGWILLIGDGRALNALTLGEETAMSLGIPLSKVWFRTVLGTALCVGASVAVSGSIGFVGLVVPHLLRPFVSQQPAKLLAVSAIGGAILLLLADTTVRMIPVNVELKLGVLTALIGAPFFLALIFSLRKKIL